MVLKHFIRRWTSVVLIFGIVGGSYLLWSHWYSIASDYMELQDLWKGPQMPEIDEVQIFLLKEPKREPWNEGKIDDYVIGGSKIVRGPDAGYIADGWRLLPRNPKLGMACFGPVYGLRFREKGQLILETTICWHCDHYTLYPLPFFGDYRPEFSFDGSSKIALLLLDALKKQVPMPEEPSKH